MTKKKGPRKGTCPVCGKVFEKTPGHRVYCSEECSVIGHRRKAAEAKRKERHGECIICGKEGVESALLVCRECLQKLLYQWARTCEPGHRKCLVCGKDFIPNSVECDADYHIHVAGQLTCSIQCTDELYAGVLDKKKRRAHTRSD